MNQIKARFYRGPMDGKTRFVQASDYAIEIAEVPKLTNENWNAWATLPLNRHIYYRTNHTHPDGSVFFEWGKPRRGKK